MSEEEPTPEHTREIVLYRLPHRQTHDPAIGSGRLAGSSDPESPRWIPIVSTVMLAPSPLRTLSEGDKPARNGLSPLAGHDYLAPSSSSGLSINAVGDDEPHRRGVGPGGGDL